MAKKRQNTPQNTEKKETEIKDVTQETQHTSELQPESEAKTIAIENLAQETAISVVAELTVETDVRKRASAIQHLQKQLGKPVEAILVVNGNDALAQECQKAFGAMSQLTWLRTSAGTGSGDALRTGIAAAKGQHILTVDALATGQPDELLGWLKDAALPESEIWVGSCDQTQGIPLKRRLGARFWNFITRFFTSLQIRDTQSGLLLMPANIAKGLLNVVKTKSIHYRSAVLYKAHLQDITLEEKTINTPENSTWNSFKQIPKFKLGVFASSWALWFKHYFISPLQKSETLQLPQKESPLFRWGFAMLSLFLLFLMPILSFDYGMTGDEHVQRVYGEYVLDYYESNGDNDNALTYKDLFNYGGLFDYWASWLNKYIWPSWDTYDGRHLLNSLVGVFLFLFIGLTARLITGRWSVALWALIFAVCSPRLFGDSMNNPKDIPFSAAYIFTIFHILRFVQQLPRPATKNIFWIMIGIAAAINIRVGGLLLIAYFGMFVGLAFLLQSRLRKKYLLHLPTLLKIVSIGLVVSVLGFWLGSAYWPYGALDPFGAAFTVLDKMSDYYVGIRIMFNGESIWSDTVPPEYIPIWLLYTSPLFILIGLALVPIMVILTIKKSPVFQLSMLSFAAIFPIAYVIYLQSGLYDGMRHMLFAYTLFPILGAWAWWQITVLLRESKIAKIGIAAALVALMALPASFMVRNHPYQYVYFNELIGGMEGAKFNFDVDYWMTSMRELSEWLVENEPRIAAGDTLRVATNCYEPVRYYFRRQEYNAKRKQGYTKNFERFEEDYKTDHIWNTEVIYTRYHERERHNWDFGIYYPRFIDKEFLSSGAYPPKQVIYSVDVDGAAIGVVVKRPTKEGFEASRAYNNKDYDTAIQLYTNIVTDNPKNESAWLFLVQAYANKLDMPNMKRCLNKMFELSDRYGTGYGWLGTYYMNVNQLDSAEMAFQDAIKYDYKYTLPYFQLARIWSQPDKAKYKEALDLLEKFDEFGGRPIEGYDLAIQIATKANDQVRLKYFSAKKNANNFQTAYGLLRDCLMLNPKYAPAVKAKRLYDEMLEKQKGLMASYKERARQAQKDKDLVRAAYFNGKILELEQKKQEAIAVYKKAAEIDPNYQPVKDKLKDLGVK